jgi:hypothetical protein
VKDSLLAYRQVDHHKEDCESHSSLSRAGDIRLLSRDSAASAYSAFSLQGLQSPPLRLKSVDTVASIRTAAAAAAAGSRMLSSSVLDSLDQNLLLHLSSLQANQLEDLENVLLPHLTVDPRLVPATTSLITMSPGVATAAAMRVSRGGSDILLDPMAGNLGNTTGTHTADFDSDMVEDKVSSIGIFCLFQCKFLNKSHFFFFLSQIFTFLKRWLKFVIF